MRHTGGFLAFKGDRNCRKIEVPGEWVSTIEAVPEPGDGVKYEVILADGRQAVATAERFGPDAIEFHLDDQSKLDGEVPTVLRQVHLWRRLL